MVKKAIYTVGRRKTAKARVVLVKGKGKIIINNKIFDEYITNEFFKTRILEPFVISNTLKKYDVKINVYGGGQNSQIDAIRLAIATAIVEDTKNDDIKEKFLEYDRSLLVADTRHKEMNKPNDSKARAKRQKSYR